MKYPRTVKYRKQLKGAIYSVEAALHQIDLGNTVYYINGMANKAVFVRVGDKYAFMYLYDDQPSCNFKFVRPTKSECLQAFFDYKPGRHLMADKDHSPPRLSEVVSPVIKDNTITITVPMGANVVIIYEGES
jgi:hypothetical protein